jgi:flagellar motility protein MotE (MotC chaperone)
MPTWRAVSIGSVVLGVTLGGWLSVGHVLRDASAASPADAATPRADGPAVGGMPAADEAGLRKLLDEVRRRTTELDQRARELDGRAATLEELEQAVGEAVADLEARDGGKSAAPCRLRGGVGRIYDNMRPEDAAAILDQLDDETLRIVFARMEARKIASIMGVMSRERAVAFTRALTSDRDGAAPARR